MKASFYLKIRASKRLFENEIVWHLAKKLKSKFALFICFFFCFFFFLLLFYRGKYKWIAILLFIFKFWTCSRKTLVIEIWIVQKRSLPFELVVWWSKTDILLSFLNRIWSTLCLAKKKRTYNNYIFFLSYWKYLWHN